MGRYTKHNCTYISSHVIVCYVCVAQNTNNQPIYAHNQTSEKKEEDGWLSIVVSFRAK